MTTDLIVVGLTGGIASGKSLVAHVLRQEDIPVIDADSLGHLVLEPEGAAYGDVVEAFGDEILGEDRKIIDRQKLGKLVFDNAEKRKRLEAITHPAIAAMARHGLDLIAQRGHRFAIYEAALLVETGLYESLKELIVVASTVANQMERLCSRDGINKEAAAVRIASQYPLEDKLAVADRILDNNGTLDELREKAVVLAGELKEKYGNGE